MQITNEILLGFIHCPYKAYRKCKSEIGEISDYEKTFNELKYSRKLLFLETLLSAKTLIRTQSEGTNFTFNDGIILDPKFSNSNTEIILDGIEFIGKNKAIPILLTPFEKTTPTDKLFVSLQASLIQSEFNIKIESCKVIYGKNLQETKFKLPLLTKNITKIISELNKMLLTSNEPSLILNKHCAICEYSASCKEKAKAEGNMGLLDRATSKTIEKYKKKGIFTIQQLSYLYKPRRRKKRAKQLVAHNLELQALALRTDKIYAQQLPELSRQLIELFLDIEGSPDQELYYLIGVLTCKDNATISNSFWADKTFDEAHIWQQFLSITNQYPDAPIYHYGNYELKAIEILGKRYNTNVTHIQNRLINIVNSIYGKIYFPVYSNRLKELANYIGMTWSSPNASGIQSIVWRHQWNETQDEKIKQILITYNLEDCFALKLLTNKLSLIQESANTLPDVDFASNPKKNETEIGQQVHQQFKSILECSYSNYHKKKKKFTKNEEDENKETENKNRGGHKKGFKGQRKKMPKPTKTIIVSKDKYCCVHTKQRLKPTSYLSKRLIIDLVFTKNGIRKTVIRYIGEQGYCKICKRAQAPNLIKQFGRTQVYGYNLKAWFVFQRIEMQLPYTKISQIIKEQFNDDTCWAYSTYFINSPYAGT
jgi:predicted RecB family nuclease